MTIQLRSFFKTSVAIVLVVATQIMPAVSYANQAPTPFKLIAPKDGGTILITSPVTFKWQTSIDPDGDIVRYTLEIAKDANFQNVIFYKKGIFDTKITIDPQVIGLKEKETYYWRVVAVDGNGAKRLSAYHIMTTDLCNNLGLDVNKPKHRKLCVFYDLNCNGKSNGNLCVDIELNSSSIYTATTFNYSFPYLTFVNECGESNRSVLFYSLSDLKVNIPNSTDTISGISTWNYQGMQTFNKSSDDNCP